ncbi:MAG: hypothetical protein WCO65_03155 [bacterium]
MKNFEASGGPKKVAIIESEHLEKIDSNKNQSFLLQKEMDSYLVALKDAISKRDEYQASLALDPNDTIAQKQLDTIQIDINIIHDKMNELALKKVTTNFNIETYEVVSKKHKKTLLKTLINTSKESNN